MEYLSTGDLVTRWNYSRQGINQWKKKEAFPAPVFYLNNGRLPVWTLGDIEAFEIDKPELKSTAHKLQKVGGYAAAVFRAKQRQRAEQAP